MWGCPHFWREIHPHLHHRIFYECRTVIGPGLHFRQLSALFGKVITSSPPNLLSLSGRSSGEIFQKRSRSLIRWTILDQANDESFWPWKRNGELFNRHRHRTHPRRFPDTVPHTRIVAAYQYHVRIPEKCRMYGRPESRGGGGVWLGAEKCGVPNAGQ